jgi:hypothetical protein
VARTREQIEKVIMTLLKLEEWTPDDEAEYEALLSEYPMDNSEDMLTIASFDEAAGMITGDLR